MIWRAAAFGLLVIALWSGAIDLLLCC